MNKNILVFRTDRIGDLLHNCPTIKTIKEIGDKNTLGLVASEKNYLYAKTFTFFDKVYLFSKESIFKKIKLFLKLYKNKYKIIFIFDGKDRSILMSLFLRSDIKVAKIVNKKQGFVCKLFNIKTSYDVFGTDLNKAHQELLKLAGISNKISNFDYLRNKKDNNFSSKIPINDYIQIHLDEKWFSQTYISSYKNINPSYEDFSNFINSIAQKKNLLITTGLITNNIIDRLEIDSNKHLVDNIYVNNIRNNIILVKKPSFIDLESTLRKANVLIACHGAIIQAAASFNLKIIDIIEENKIELVKRYNSYIKNYYTVYRDKFSLIKTRINQLI